MESTTKTVLMMLARRGVSALGVFLVAHSALAAGDQPAFVEMGAGIAVAGAEFALEWWRKSGMVMISAQVARLKSIPMPQEAPKIVAPAVGSAPAVEVKSTAA